LESEHFCFPLVIVFDFTEPLVQKKNEIKNRVTVTAKPWRTQFCDLGRCGALFSLSLLSNVTADPQARAVRAVARRQR
jgi:hypothetical protein